MEGGAPRRSLDLATLATGKLSEIFEDFLKTFTDRSGQYAYRNRMSDLISNEGKSLNVDFDDLLRYNNDVANKILLEPDTSLAEFKKAAYETLRSENPFYADRIKRALTVRIRGIPDRIPLRKVDTSHLEKLMAVAGMVVRTSELRPLLMEGAFVCPNGHVTLQAQDDPTMKKPLRCEECDETRNLDIDVKLSRFVDFQILRVQELPEELPPGQLPQFFDVNVEGDIVNTARPGDRVVLTGIVRAVQDFAPGQGRMRLFRSQIDCNYVEVIGKEPENVQISKEDEALIRSIAASPDAYQKLINSISPAILGNLAQKEAILLLLAGGATKHLPDGTKLRGEINVFLVGDPGVAKSEMLKFAAQVAPRGIFASGRGTTSAGLSAAVIREKNVLMLEAGVVVLGDQGIAAIDEFDKMKPEDRSALHEQMEQGTVTVAKGGIYAILNARTSILAATNPVLGKYNPYQNLTDNITLPIPLLTRFDLIFVMKDTPSPAEDDKLASHILAVHRKMGYDTIPPVEFNLLKKYIAYAKKITPVLTKEAESRLKDYYLDLRRRGGEGQIGATPRTLESLVRLSTARARILLRDQVTEDDALTAIALMNKMVEDVLTDAVTKTKADFGVLLGRPAGERGKMATALELFKKLEGQDKRPVDKKVFKEELVTTGKMQDEDAEKMIRTLFKEGLIYESKPGFFRRVGT
jgi:replicative DNA helicase Mcm